MLYLLYLPDGRIHQANKLYVAEDELPAYEGRLHDQGQAFLKVATSPGLIPPECFYVDTGAMELCERPVMQAVAETSTVPAGGNAVILNIPRGATIDLMTSNVTVHSVTLQGEDDELEFSIPVPCIYRAMIRKWPYRDCQIDIEAVA
ncbi:hypothetical protein [Bradyrhizobium cenepequi]